MIIVTGAEGALGRWLVYEARRHGGEVYGYTHADLDIATDYDLGRLAKYPGAIVLAEHPGALIFNAAGVTYTAGASPAEMVRTNAYGPHILAEVARIYGQRVVHFSTDCVFSGRDVWASRDQQPTPVDLYGRSKLAGELEGPHLTLRCSFVDPRTGLWRWLRGHEGPIDGWVNAWWNGSTAREVARVAVRLGLAGVAGVRHLGTPYALTKYEVLRQLMAYDGHPGELRRHALERPVHRALSPDYQLRPLSRALRDLRYADRYRNDDLDAG